MQDHILGKVPVSIFFPKLAYCVHFRLFQMALMMQPTLFPSWLLYYFGPGTGQAMDKSRYAFCSYEV